MPETDDQNRKGKKAPDNPSPKCRKHVPYLAAVIEDVKIFECINCGDRVPG